MSFTSFSNDQPNKKSFIYNIPVAFRNTKKAAIKCGFSLLLSAQRLSFFLCLDYILTKHEMILVFRVGKFKSSYIHVAGMYLGMTFMGMEHNAERAEALVSDAAKKGNDEARFVLKLINDWKGEERLLLTCL